MDKLLRINCRNVKLISGYIEVWASDDDDVLDGVDCVVCRT